jgi:SAM-dependent methyltransferase
MSAEGWNYFHEDVAYAKELAERLHKGVEMDSARGIAAVMRDRLRGDLSVLDFGSGPGHYVPVLKNLYDQGALRYRGIDIVPASVDTGNRYFAHDPSVSFALGSVLEPAASYAGENCLISANTLPHVPSIEPLMRFIARTPEITHFVFRMLIGSECVEIRKHLAENSFEGMFERGYQLNNIYSPRYLEHLVGAHWGIEVLGDRSDDARLAQHSVPFQNEEPFYGNRVSRVEDGKIFKGDIYMPWKFVFGRRKR